MDIISIYSILNCALTVSTAVDCSQTGVLLLQSIQITHYSHLRNTWRWMKPANAYWHEIQLQTLLNVHSKTHRYRTILEDSLNILRYTRGSHSLRVGAADITTDKPALYTNYIFYCFLYKKSKWCSWEHSKGHTLIPAALQSSGHLSNGDSLSLVLHPDAQNRHLMTGGRLGLPHL